MAIVTKLKFVLCCTAFLAMVPRAGAEDKLIVAISGYNAWESAAAALGQDAGFFNRRGLELEFRPTRNSSESEQLVISGQADVGAGVNIMSAMRSYAFGAPLRIIGAQIVGSTGYWYVLKYSPIKSFRDIDGKTIAYESNGSLSHYDAMDFVQEFDINAKLVLTGSASATFAHVNNSTVDIGWAAPPFGIDKIAHGDIRVIARAKDVPSIRNKTTMVLITNAQTLEKRKQVLERFIGAYREAVEWLYSDPAALRRYAELTDMSEEVARLLRDEFFSKEMLIPDKISGLNASIKEAIASRYLRAGLSRGEIRDLVPIAPPTLIERVLCVFISSSCPIELVPP